MSEYKRDIYKLLEKHEGRSNKLYKCPAGKLTIGVGWNIEDNGLPDDVIDLLARYGVRIAAEDLLDTIGITAYKNLNDEQLDALLDMSYNLGRTKLRLFKKMIKALQDGDYKKAKEEMLDSKWAKQVPERAKELANMVYHD